jgi:hypothetical protein
MHSREPLIQLKPLLRTSNLLREIKAFLDLTS